MARAPFSLKIADLIKRADETSEPPAALHDLKPEQRCALTAYWRARAVRFAGGVATLRLVEDYSQDDMTLPGVKITRKEVRDVLLELRSQGWSIDLPDLERPAKVPRTPKAERAAKEPTKALPKLERQPKTERPRAKSNEPALVQHETGPPELVGDADERSVKVTR